MSHRCRLQFSNNESSEVVDNLLHVTFYFKFLTLRPGLIIIKTSDDSLFASSSPRGERKKNKKEEHDAD